MNDAAEPGTAVADDVRALNAAGGGYQQLHFGNGVVLHSQYDMFLAAGFSRIGHLDHFVLETSPGWARHAVEQVVVTAHV